MSRYSKELMAWSVYFNLSRSFPPSFEHYQSIAPIYFIIMNCCSFEDHNALHGGNDGLNVIHIILQGAAHILKPNGYVSLNKNK